MHNFHRGPCFSRSVKNKQVANFAKAKQVKKSDKEAFIKETRKPIKLNITFDFAF